MKLKPCPCGETPQTLHGYQPSHKWSFVSGSCCNEWYIEFRSQYASEEREWMRLAAEAWNEAKRG